MLTKRHKIIAWSIFRFSPSCAIPLLFNCFFLLPQLLLYLCILLISGLPNACLFASLTHFLFAFFYLRCLYLSFLCAEPSVFQAQPSTPPSAAQEATQSPIESSPFLHSVKRLFLNVNYMLLLTSYGMNVGVFYAISTLLNRVSMHFFFG